MSGAWMIEAALDAYTRGYVRGSEGDSAYVQAADPLRAVVRGSGGEAASVRLGVDPGGFFCGALFAALIAARQAGALASRARVGFVHVPPDQACSAEAAASLRLHPRAVNLAMIARVLGCLLEEELLVGPGDRRVLITGFGAFEGVHDNPTEAFVREPGAVDQMIGWAAPGARRIEGRKGGLGLLGVDRFRAGCGGRTLEVVTGLVALARSPAEALAGRYLALAAIEAQIRGLLVGPLDAVIGLGVDSGQIVRERARSPVFKVETQTWGWQRGDAQGLSEGAPPQRCLDLAAVMMRARARGGAALEFLQEAAAS